MIPIITSSRAVERQAIDATLRIVERGAVITYQELTIAAECPIKAVWHVVARVRDELTTDGYVFEAIPNVGLKRLTDAEICVAVPSSRRRKIHRQAKRGTMELAAIRDVASLSDFDRSTALIGRSLFGAIAAITTHRAITAIAVTVARTGNVLPVDKTIEAFAGIK